MNQRLAVYRWVVAVPLVVMALLLKPALAEQPSLSIPANSSSDADHVAQCSVLDLELQHRYEGQCLNGLAHGQGVARGDHNAFYQGHFEQGAKSGYGVKLYANGDAYAGYW